jgi:hypothetical protein
MSTSLNGSAPSLRRLSVLERTGNSFPSSPRLLLPASHLSTLNLRCIPNTGYISPEVIGTFLSALRNLEYLAISFKSPSPHPKRRSRPPFPLMRTVLPVLSSFYFRGVSEQLGILVAQIDAPLLDDIRIESFKQPLICGISKTSCLRHSTDQSVHHSRRVVQAIRDILVFLSDDSSP